VPPPSSLQQTRVVLVIPLLHYLGNVFADLFLAVVLPLLSLFDHLPHDKDVLHVCQKVGCLHVHNGRILSVAHDPSHSLRHLQSYIWFGLHRQLQNMLLASEDLPTGVTSFNRFHEHESKGEQQGQHDLGLNVKFECEVRMECWNGLLQR
jgi:hypothetical protein